MGWTKEKGMIAERFEKNDLPSFLHMEFTAKTDESVVLQKDGEIYIEKEHGRLAVSNLLDDFTDIVMLDKSEKTLESELNDVRLSDGRSMGMKLALRFRIFNSDHFIRNLMCERDKMFISDIRDETFSDIICMKILPKLGKKPASTFAGDGFIEKIKSFMEAEIKKRFRDWGMLLTSLTVSLKSPIATSESRECSYGNEKECAPAEDENDAAAIGKAEKRAGAATREEEFSELENERAEKEVAMALEKKQAQNDMEAALEAMELKEIQEKKKKLKETGIKTEERQKLEEDMESLKKAKDITEHKFYKKELSEDSFRRMMEDFEKRIIEIETKLRKK